MRMADKDSKKIFPKKWKWESSKMLKPRDTFASSEFSELVPFRPSFEKDKSHPNMFDVLSMEFERIWRRELDEVLRAPVIDKDESVHILIRPQIMKKKKTIKSDVERSKPLFYMKKFLKVPARVNSFRPKDDKVWNKIVSNKNVENSYK
ncbi:uncharacterized protein isoform X2 [Rhodnius prolixus]|uniref:uncharacterized protein isoform X2 n=1 Tax=Rhodnius prolixus TaxID=13249 RepID=UPI003D18BC1C